MKKTIVKVCVLSVFFISVVLMYIFMPDNFISYSARKKYVVSPVSINAVVNNNISGTDREDSILEQFKSHVRLKNEQLFVGLRGLK